MQVIQIENNDCTKTRALLVPKYEWIRLKKILTNKYDTEAAIEETKRLMDERQAASKKIAKSWDITTLNKRRKQLENRRQLLADIEAKQLQKDEMIKLDILERRKAIMEKVQLKKWSEKDSTKTLNRAVHKMEVLKERAIQMEFDKEERKRVLEEERLMKIEQNLEAERYRKDQWEQKLKLAEIKKVNAAVILKDLKEREVKKCKENFKLNEEEKAELQRIVKEIEEEKEKKRVKLLEAKENMLKNLNDNREIVERNNQQRQLEEQEENKVIAIMYETKMKIAKIRKLKEIELIKEKQMLSEKIMEKTNKNEAEIKVVTDLAFKNAIDEKERQYQKEQLQNEEIMKKNKIEFIKNKKITDEENQKEKERFKLSCQFELEKREREAVVLCDLKKLQRQAKIKEMNSFRKNLDEQCDNNRIASTADKQADIKQYEALIKLWRQEDDKFMDHAKNLIVTYEKAGRSVLPLLRAIEDYVKNNILLVNAANKNSTKIVPNIPLHKVCI